LRVPGTHFVGHGKEGNIWVWEYGLYNLLWDEKAVFGRRKNCCKTVKRKGV